MGIFERARTDSKRYSQEVSLTFYKIANTEYTVKGLATRHHLGVDPDTGLTVNSRNVHCTVSESLLTTQGYSTRNSNGDVNLVNSFVKYADATGVVRTYKINEVLPDDSLGLIVCILGTWQA